MKKNKKPIIYEFDPVIYPRKLWVCIDIDEEFINQHFHGYGGGKLNFNYISGYDAVTFDDVVRNDNKKIGELVIFCSKNDMRIVIIAHEASHIVDGIEKAIGMKHGDEPSAYLLGWVCRCINIARLGECEPLIFESEKIENSKK